MIRIRYAVVSSLVSVVALALAGFGSGATAYASPAAASGVVSDDSPAVPGKLLLMLDASGSMNEKDPSGLTKIAAAKKALVSTVDALPADATVGLRVYGATQPGGKPTKAACADTQLVHPIERLDKPGLTRAINGFKAKGETPIAYSLQEALGDLGATGKRNIVLVSDGEESCVPDPCPTVKKLVGSGVDLQIDTVGFGVNAKARKQLQCLADAGHGTYYDAKNAGQLSQSLNKVSQRALRPFTVSGTPVRADVDETAAPRLAPGQYTDSFVASSAPRYYRLDRPAGSTVRFSVVARPPVVHDSFAQEDWEVVLQTEDGVRCNSDRSAGIEFFRAGESVAVSATVSGTPRRPGDDEPCLTEPLVAQVNHLKGSATPQDVEVLYLAEPGVTTTAGLPPALPKTDQQVADAPVTAPVRPVVGGGSFSNSPVIETGTYSDTILPGEELFYRVRLEWGQSAAFTVDVPRPGQELNYGSFDATLFQVRAYNPARADWYYSEAKRRNRDNITAGQQAMTLGETVPQIRYQNRDRTAGYDDRLLGSSIPGYYYFTVTRQSGKEGTPTMQPIDLRIRVAVRGSAANAPSYARLGTLTTALPTTTSAGPTSPTHSSTTSSSTVAASKDGDGSGAGLVVGLGVLVLLGLVGAGGYLWRRRATGSHGG